MNIVLFVDEHSSVGVPSLRWNRFVEELVADHHQVLVVDLEQRVHFHTGDNSLKASKTQEKMGSSPADHLVPKKVGKKTGQVVDWLSIPIRNLKKWIEAFSPSPDGSWNRSRGRVLVASQWMSQNQWAPDLVVGSYPFSGNLRSARRLAEDLGKPFVIDYRDPWADFYFHFHSKIKWLNRRICRLEASYNSAADLIICLNQTMKRRLRLEPGQDQKVRILSNHFVPDRTPRPVASGDPKVGGPVHIVFTGSLTIDYAVKSFTQMVLESQQNRDPNSLVFHFYGRLGHGVKTLLSPLLRRGIAMIHDPVSRDECIRIQSEADALLMLGLNHEANDCVVSTKVYEYFSADRPVIAYSEFPMGELEKLFSSWGKGVVLYGKTAGAGFFEDRCDELRNKILNHDGGSSPSGRDSEKRITDPKLGDILISVMESQNSPR